MWRLHAMRAAAALVLLLALASCAGTRPAPGQSGRQTGIASYYAGKFHGRRTASGERYDMYAMTAAHPTLPFGTKVRVTNLENGRSVELRINDRGPFRKGRVIDVSYAAARELAMVRKGTVKVRLEVK